jgi:hypothetical protein
MKFPGFNPHPLRKGWRAGPTHGVDGEPVLHEARRLQDDARAAGKFALCGFDQDARAYRVFIVPGKDVMAVARARQIATLQKKLWCVGPMRDEESSIATYLREKQEVHLWWD